MSKDLWFAEFERIQNELEDAGVSPEKAYDMAADKAHGALLERLADMADLARLRKKEGR